MNDSEECETVLIETPAGPTRINKIDFDEKLHTLVGKKEKPAVTVNGYQLVKNGERGRASRFIIVDGKGEAVTLDGVDQEGYKTEEEASIIMQMLPPVV